MATIEFKKYRNQFNMPEYCSLCYAPIYEALKLSNNDKGFMNICTDVCWPLLVSRGRELNRSGFGEFTFPLNLSIDDDK